MSETLEQRRTEAIRAAARQNDRRAIDLLLEDIRSEDVAVLLGRLDPREQVRVMAAIGDDQRVAEILPNLRQDKLEEVVSALEHSQLVRALEQMAFDDEADVLARLPEELRARVLQDLDKFDKQQVETILAWPEDSAGGIMVPVAFRLREDVTCADAVRAVQSADAVEMVTYAYVENAERQLVGVASLRDLLTHPPNVTLETFMEKDVIAVLPTTDQQEVARLAGHYDLVAIPVVDDERHLLGIVTIDDLLDVVEDEAHEDMLLMAGVGEEEPRASALSAARQRLGWLSITLVGGIGMAELIGMFEHALEREAVLAGFIPVMLGMGGNVGIQAATIAVRNLVTGRIERSGALGLLLREMRVGALLGLTFAAVLCAYTTLRHGELMLGLAIAAAIVTEVAAAAAFGSLVPLTLHRCGVDPAVATGPVVTTGIDLLAILIYFYTVQAVIGP